MISKAVGLLQMKNKILIKYKLLSLIFVLMVNSTALQAETYFCQIEDERMERWFNIKFLEIDTTRGVSRLGTRKKWLGFHKVKSQKAGIGMIYSWDQGILVTFDNKGKIQKFNLKLRIKKDGSSDLKMKKPKRSWTFKTFCKTN